MAKPDHGLGKGLEALFGSSETLAPGKTEQPRGILSIDKIVPNEDQPRKYFDQTTLQELAMSISQQGLLQPLLVRPLSEGIYQLVAGERRWKACKMLGMRTVPVIIKELTDEEAVAAALIENLQRDDLNPMEEALGYKDLRDNFGLSQEEISSKVGKSRSAVANTLRLLQLPLPLQEDIAGGKITQGHARPLLGIDDEEVVLRLRDLILKLEPNVREVENWVINWKNTGILPGGGDAGSEAVRPPRKAKDPGFKKLEKELGQLLDLKVTLNGSVEKGSLRVAFSSKDELAALLKTLGCSSNMEADNS